MLLVTKIIVLACHINKESLPNRTNLNSTHPSSQHVPNIALTNRKTCLDNAPIENMWLRFEL